MVENKKAQEEIVGFVVVVTLVIIIGLVFLGIALRKDNPSTTQESKEISQFLESVMQYTSSCAVSFEPDFATLSQLFQYCQKGSFQCVSRESPCQVLNQTLAGIIEASFPITQDAYLKGYDLTAFYSTNLTEEEFLSIKKGLCTSTVKGAEAILPASPGSIVVTLKLCS